MGRPPVFPISIRHGVVTVKIYREKSATGKEGGSTVPGPLASVRLRVPISEEALAEAELKAWQLALGLAQAQHVQRSDIVRTRGSAPPRWLLSSPIRDEGAFGRASYIDAGGRAHPAARILRRVMSCVKTPPAMPERAGK